MILIPRFLQKLNVIVSSFAVVAIGFIAVGCSAPSMESSNELESSDRPAFVMSETDPVHPAKCGEDVGYVSGSGHPNFDFEYQTKHSTLIVEGVARLVGPARLGDEKFESGMTRRDRMDVAGTIHTPFEITVSKTYKGLEHTVWPVSELGGTVECLTYLQHESDARLFDGVSGLFFISSSPLFDGDWVTLTIAEDAPEWFEFTENNFGSIEDAVAFVESFE
ncbi:hypothetical protein JYU04_00110 [Dehalococcoides mccartyi]|nr:hypothetical protein [Dehalococcoides mccartyi]